MYQNIYVKRTKTSSEVHIWDDKTGYSKFQYKPYAYLKSQSGTHRSLYGDKLKKVNYWTGDDLQNGRVFESDIPIETRTLVDMYPESEEPSVGHREVYFDIECEVTDGFPDPQRAENKITAIALYDKTMDSYHCFVLGDVPNTDVVESFQSEEELLQRFYQKYLEINPTILSGWNIDGFDIPYLYNRTDRVLGKQFANSLSPIGEVFYSEHKKKYKIAGVSCLDYLPLYKLFTYTQQSSYRLDYIGQLEVGLGKIEFDGTLQDLYETDINKYIEYNLNDVIIVKKLDDKLKLIELARGISHVGRTPYEDVYFSSRYLEGAILVYLKNIEVVAPNKALDAREKMNRDGNQKFTGAYVKDPNPGRYEWVYDLDLTSMYPSVIMSLNISPEMKIGKVNGWDGEEFIKGVSKTYSLEKNGKEQGHMNNEELAGMFKSNKVSISSNGILYRNDKKGLIPSLLSKWFDERVEYKRLMKKYSDEGDKEKSAYFKRRQHVQKIVLNSLYGVLGLPVFRFYDIDNAEATTVTGQELIKFTEKIANSYYNTKLGDKEDYCIYTDTDSVFYSAIPLVKKDFPNADLTDDKFMTEKILETAEVVQNYINKSYDLFAKRFLNIDEHRFDIKQECVAKSAFWVTKKRYGQWIINDGGIVCDRLDVKGLDIVRSSFPPAMRKLMTGVLQDILGNVDKDSIDEDILKFKKEMKTSDIQDIALPTGVRKLTKFKDKTPRGAVFTTMRKGTPVHVKAAWIYNDLLKYWGLNNFEKIKSSEKIKWVYLKPNTMNIKQIGFKGYDDPPKIMEFIKENIDYDKLFTRALEKKIRMFYEALKWDMPVDKINTLERFFLVSKVLLVGNGGSLKDKNISGIIDSFDIVCRFNWGGSKISFDKYNKFIGNKKNIWFNFNISNLLKDKKITTNPYNIEYLNSYEKIYISGTDWITNPKIKSTTNSIENFINLTSEQFDMIKNSNLINLNKIFDTEINNVWIFPNNYSELIRTEIPLLSKNIPSTGLKAIHFLLKEYDKLYLCGFDGFKSAHFYGDEEENKVVRLGYENHKGHSGKKEMEHIKQLEIKNKIEFINNNA